MIVVTTCYLCATHEPLAGCQEGGADMPTHSCPRPGDSALLVIAAAFREESHLGSSYNTITSTDACGVLMVPLGVYYEERHISDAQLASHPRAHPGAQAAQPPCPVATIPAPQEASAHAAPPKKHEQLDARKQVKQAVPLSLLHMPVWAPTSKQHFRRPVRMPSVQGPASCTVAQPDDVEQPHRPQISEALRLVAPTLSTPSYSALLAKLASADDRNIMHPRRLHLLARHIAVQTARRQCSAA